MAASGVSSSIKSIGFSKNKVAHPSHFSCATNIVTGPYASIANPVAMALKIPRAATETPFIAANLKLKKILISIANIVMRTDSYPKQDRK